MIDPRLPTGLDLGQQPQGLPLRVLVLESSSRTGGILQELSALSGFSVECARHPDDALRRLRAEFFDVIVIELPSPLLAPDELFRRIEGISPEQADRIVFLANDLSDAETRRFLTAAGRPFLTSPADPDELNDLVLRTGLSEKDA